MNITAHAFCCKNVQQDGINMTQIQHIYAWSNLPVIFWLVVMSTLVSILVMIHSGLYCRAMASLYHLVTDLQSYCQPGQAQTKRQEHTDMEEKR